MIVVIRFPEAITESGKAMSTHAYAQKLLAEEDAPMDWWICRACRKRVNPDHLITTGARSISEGCFGYHLTCLEALSPEARAESNKITSRFFAD